MTIGFWNCGGYKNFLENSEDFARWDVMCLCETWRTEDVAVPCSGSWSQHRAVSSSAIREKTRGRASGGLSVLIHPNINFTLLEKNKFWIIVKLQGLGKNLILGNFYFKPNLVLEDIYEQLENSLSSIILREQEDTFIIGGDFNSRVGGLNVSIPDPDSRGNLKNIRNYLDTTVDKRGREMCELFEGLGFVLLNGRTNSDGFGGYTFVNNNGTSTVDLVRCRMSGLVEICDLKVMEYAECSGHFPLKLSLEASPCTNSRDHLRKTIEIYRFEESSRSLYAVGIEESLKNHFYFADNVPLEKINEFFINTIKNVSEGLGMKKCLNFSPGLANDRRSRNKPWFDQECHHKKCEARRAARKCQKGAFKEPLVLDLNNSIK